MGKQQRQKRNDAEHIVDDAEIKRVDGDMTDQNQEISGQIEESIHEEAPYDPGEDIPPFLDTNEEVQNKQIRQDIIYIKEGQRLDNSLLIYSQLHKISNSLKIERTRE
ncbi:hypothetical protein AMTR_s00170p00051420 [Amborella trichopoda]|uniref:Uncharacterized protein n=1 Tax=Amborella trichopoda TaxID=13333 RepID=W1NTC7_AMBTC|nr:hypothetical protein AMTR_s00170p00051420 [Amborella trichopoda]